MRHTTITVSEVTNKIIIVSLIQNNIIAFEMINNITAS